MTVKCRMDTGGNAVREQIESKSHDSANGGTQCALKFHCSGKMKFQSCNSPFTNTHTPKHSLPSFPLNRIRHTVTLQESYHFDSITFNKCISDKIITAKGRRTIERAPIKFYTPPPQPYRTHTNLIHNGTR